MKILHICNDFASSKVHTNLFFELDKLGTKQTIYTYFRSSRFYDKNKFESERVNFIYSGKLVKFYHRIFYHYKVSVFYRDLLSVINPLEYDCVNATTLFSDGALAYRIYCEYNRPYIVTVRSTDVRIFMKYMPHTWMLAGKILKNASRIIFVSKSSMYEFLNKWMLKDMVKELSSKIIFQPNGIDDFWLDNICLDRKLNNNILYVGQFVYRKNLLKLIAAILKMQKGFPDIKLSIVGGEGNCEAQVLRTIRQHSDIINFYGKVVDKERLKEIYRENSVFAMPSIRETFGLTYLEALSQNLILLYTQGEGFDGIIDGKIGEAVKPNVNEIETGLSKILLHREEYINNEKVDFAQYRWSFIAKRYLCLYESVVFK